MTKESEQIPAGWARGEALCIYHGDDAKPWVAIARPTSDEKLERGFAKFKDVHAFNDWLRWWFNGPPLRTPAARPFHFDTATKAAPANPFAPSANPFVTNPFK